MRKDELVDLYVEKTKKFNQLLKQVALNDLFVFNKQVLNIEEGLDNSGRHRVPLAPVHKEVCDFVQHSRKNKKLILMPRGHLKTSLITIGRSLQMIAKNPNIRILIGNATSAMAQAFLSQIKKHLQYNKTFISLYGNLASNAPKWRDDMITLAPKGQENMSYQTKEATITAYGVGGNLVSQHYDAIILDDLHNRDNISTKDQIEKVKTVFKDILDLLEPNGEMIILGTRWHYDDLYGWLMNPDNPAGRDFDIFLKRAIDSPVIERGEKGGYSIKGGTILWSDKYSRKTLTKLLNEKGKYEWSCQYQNNPVDDELAVFKRAWFKEYDPTELKGMRMTRFTAIDPAISLKERADYTAIVTIGVDKFENIYILEIKRGHFSEKRIADELFSTFQKWHPISITIEAVAFQKVLQHFIESEMKNRRIKLPFEEVVPDSRESKEKRIRSLQPYYMRGNIYHSKGVAYMDYLEDELLRFPKGKNDDTIDALAYAVSKSFAPRNRRHREHGSYHWLY